MDLASPGFKVHFKRHLQYERNELNEESGMTQFPGLGKVGTLRKKRSDAGLGAWG